MRIFNILIFVAFILTSCQTQQNDISLNLELGKVYKLLSNSKTTIIQDFNGQKNTMETTLQGSMSYLVKNVLEDSYDMEVKYESLKMIMKLPQETMEFNSENNNKPDIFSSILAQMINKPFHITLTKKGIIKEIKNIEYIFESAFGSFSQIPADQLELIKSHLMKSYGEEAFIGNIEMVTAIYPDKSVVKGENWVIKTKLNSEMAADITTTYKLKENHSDYYLIVGESIIATSDKDAILELNEMPTKYDLTGNMSSKLKIDKISGWILEAEINHDIQGEVFILENPIMPEGMNIPMILKTTLTYTNK